MDHYAEAFSARPGKVLAVGIPVRRQRPADELLGAGGVAGAVPEPPGMARG